LRKVWPSVSLLPAHTWVQAEEICFRWTDAFSENFTEDGLLLKCVRKFTVDQNRKNEKHLA
jgi:hypothetical protein